MTAVLAFHTPEVPGLVSALGGTGEGHAVMPAPKPGDTLNPAVAGPLLDLAASLLSGHEALVAVYPVAAAPRVAPLLKMLRGALDTVAVAAVASPLGPVGTATLAGVMARLAETDQVTAGNLVAGARWLEGELFSVAWLPSVVGLDLPGLPGLPGLSMVDYLRSYLPGTAFALSMSPERRLVRLGQGADHLPAPRALGPRPVVVVGGPRELADRVGPVLLPAIAGTPVLRPAAGDEATAWWPVRKVVEVAATPADVTPWAAELGARHPTAACRWCGLAAGSSPCPFCELADPRQEAGARATSG